MPKLEWTQDIFSKEKNDNEIWENWFRASTHSSPELIEIVYGQFQEEFQRRALFLLLIPDARLAPFCWHPPNYTVKCACNYLGYEVDFRKVESGLRAHAIYWLTKFIDYARWQLPASVSSDQKALLLDTYNKYILQLLAVLPAEDNQAETLFPYFSINDQTVWTTDNDASGYKPLLQLWKNPQINECWKRLAETEIRQIIKRELRGESHPREPYENALKCYARHLQFVLDETGHLPYSKELFADQIRFLIYLEVSDQYLFQPWKVAPILNILAGEEYLDLRHQFIRFVLLRDGNFSIFSEETEKVANMVIKEFSDDSQIYRAVFNQLNAYQDQNKAVKQKAEEKTIAKEALLSPMRRSPDIPLNENQSER